MCHFLRRNYEGTDRAPCIKTGLRSGEQLGLQTRAGGDRHLGDPQTRQGVRPVARKLPPWLEGRAPVPYTGDVSSILTGGSGRAYYTAAREGGSRGGAVHLRPWPSGLGTGLPVRRRGFEPRRPLLSCFASVAQLVAQRTLNPFVGGSSPPGGIVEGVRPHGVGGSAAVL